MHAQTKDQVLLLLLQAGGNPRSGEEMAQTIGISRAAVWKAIESLRKEGHEIASIPRRGYTLAAESDILTKVGIAAQLPSALGTEGNLWVFEELPSTNQTAKKMAIDGAPHGTVVIANRQTAGKGRYGRSFYSPPGSGLYLSIVLRGAWVEEPTRVTASSAALVCEAIEVVSGISPHIKWVNDLICPQSGGKLCGILTEAVTNLESGVADFLVVGIGINVYAADFPKDLAMVATALFLAGQEADAPPALCSRLAAEIITRVLTAPNWITAPETYHAYRSRLALLGQPVMWHQLPNTYHATVVDLDEQYHLIVQCSDGAVRTLSSGEVSVRGSLTIAGKDDTL